MDPILTIWILFLFITGTAMFLKMRARYRTSSVIKGWDKVTGIITHIYCNNEWYELTAKVPRTDTVMIRYTYKHAGVNYTSSSVFMDSEATLISSQNVEGQVFKHDIPLFVQNIQEKPELVVWVNPDNPRQSVLVDLSPQNYAFSLVGLVVIVWAICLTLLLSDAFSINIAKKIKVLEQKEVVEGNLMGAEK
jgi:hypothetical protein